MQAGAGYMELMTTNFLLLFDGVNENLWARECESMSSIIKRFDPTIPFPAPIPMSGTSNLQ